MAFRLINKNYPYPEIYTNKYKNILILAPHPDDEIIGLGGFIIKNKKQINSILIFSNAENKIRVEESKKISKYLGIKFKFIFSKNRINRNKVSSYLIENIMNIKPDLILVPSFYETHPDHLRLLYGLSDALKKIPITSHIGMYEIWNTSTPNFIIDISDIYEIKTKLIKLYKSQLINFDYINFSKSLNSYRGMQINKKYGEGIILLTNSEFKKIMI